MLTRHKLFVQVASITATQVVHWPISEILTTNSPPQLPMARDGRADSGPSGLASGMSNMQTNNSQLGADAHMMQDDANSSMLNPSSFMNQSSFMNPSSFMNSSVLNPSSFMDVEDTNEQTRLRELEEKVRNNPPRDSQYNASPPQDTRPPASTTTVHAAGVPNPAIKAESMERNNSSSQITPPAQSPAQVQSKSNSNPASPECDVLSPAARATADTPPTEPTDSGDTPSAAKRAVRRAPAGPTGTPDFFLGKKPSGSKAPAPRRDRTPDAVVTVDVVKHVKATPPPSPTPSARPVRAAAKAGPSFADPDYAEGGTRMQSYPGKKVASVSSSSFRGVSWHAPSKQWRATIFASVSSSVLVPQGCTPLFLFQNQMNYFLDTLIQERFP